MYLRNGANTPYETFPMLRRNGVRETDCEIARGDNFRERALDWTSDSVFATLLSIGSDTNHWRAVFVIEMCSIELIIGRVKRLGEFRGRSF